MSERLNVTDIILSTKVIKIQFHASVNEHVAFCDNPELELHMRHPSHVIMCVRQLAHRGTGCHTHTVPVPNTVSFIMPLTVCFWAPGLRAKHVSAFSVAQKCNCMKIAFEMGSKTKETQGPVQSPLHTAKKSIRTTFKNEVERK